MGEGLSWSEHQFKARGVTLVTEGSVDCDVIYDSKCYKKSKFGQ